MRSGWSLKDFTWSVLPKRWLRSLPSNRWRTVIFFRTFRWFPVWLFAWFYCALISRLWQAVIFSLSKLLGIHVVLIHESPFLVCCVRLDNLLVVSPWHCCCLWSHLLRWSGFLESCCHAAILESFLHLTERPLSKVLNWSDSILKLFQVEPSICVQVHSSNNWYQQRIIWIYAAFYKETFQVWSVDKIEVAIINAFVESFEIEVVWCGKVLFKHFRLTSKLQLLLQKFGKESFNVISKEFTIVNGVGWPLGCLSTKVLLVTGKKDLQEIGILESSFASRIKELNQMSAAHVANLINSIIPHKSSKILRSQVALTSSINSLKSSIRFKCLSLAQVLSTEFNPLLTLPSMCQKFA